MKTNTIHLKIMRARHAFISVMKTYRALNNIVTSLFKQWQVL